MTTAEVKAISTEAYKRGLRVWPDYDNGEVVIASDRFCRTISWITRFANADNARARIQRS